MWTWIAGIGSAVVGAIGIAVGWLTARSIYRQSAERDLREQLENCGKEKAAMQMHISWLEGQNIELMRRLVRASNGGTPEVPG